MTSTTTQAPLRIGQACHHRGVLRSSLICLGLLLALSVVPTAASAATCSVRGQERKLGPTYTTLLTVTKASCTTGKRLVRAYYKCRLANGGKDGRCRKRVLGYSCTERRTNVISTQYDSRVTCSNGSRRIVHAYTQFT